MAIIRKYKQTDITEVTMVTVTVAMVTVQYSRHGDNVSLVKKTVILRRRVVLSVVWMCNFTELFTCKVGVLVLCLGSKPGLKC